MSYYPCVISLLYIIILKCHIITWYYHNLVIVHSLFISSYSNLLTFYMLYVVTVPFNITVSHDAIFFEILLHGMNVWLVKFHYWLTASSYDNTNCFTIKIYYTSHCKCFSVVLHNIIAYSIFVYCLATTAKYIYLFQNAYLIL